MYYTYIIECEDSSLYTGVAKDVSHRMLVHSKKIKQSAKYTRSHTIKSLRAVWESENRSSAQKLEYRIKQLPKAKKLLLIEKPEQVLEFFPELSEFEYFPDRETKFSDCI